MLGNSMQPEICKVCGAVIQPGVDYVVDGCHWQCKNYIKCVKCGRIMLRATIEDYVGICPYCTGEQK